MKKMHLFGLTALGVGAATAIGRTTRKSKRNMHRMMKKMKRALF
ncbi:MAG: hypothetical protein ACRC5C_08715 [Bacilli bacterium]